MPYTNYSHRQDVNKLGHCKSKTACHKMEKTIGCRYSSLLGLPYFDPPAMLVIHPMHCLSLGVAKHFLKGVLIEHVILSQIDLFIIQN